MPPTAEMVALLYEELRRLAAGYFSSQPVGHTLQPTVVVNEAYLKLCGAGDGEGTRWANSAHFLAHAATAMRHVLVDHARMRATLKRGGHRRVSLDTFGVEDRSTRVDVLALHEAIERLAARDERAAKVVELRFFAGLTIDQTATALGVSDFTVEKDWRAARAWLARELRQDAEDGGVGR